VDATAKRLGKNHSRQSAAPKNSKDSRVTSPGGRRLELEAAEEAGLRYVSENQPGYGRKAKGDDFEYFDTEGKAVGDEQRLLRIKRLAIPPAWTDVWISPTANGHVQATGRDARKRKQYIYHERWREIRDENKYERIVSFGKALPKIRPVCRQTKCWRRSCNCSRTVSSAWGTKSTLAKTNRSASRPCKVDMLM